MLVDTLDKLREVAPDLLACMDPCVDTETTGLDAFGRPGRTRDHVIGISIDTGTGAYYFPFRHGYSRPVSATPSNLPCSLLEPGGFFHLRTDHERYFGEMMEVMAAMPQFQGIPVPEAVSVHRTAFELRFVRLGQPVFLRSYRLDPARTDGR